MTIIYAATEDQHLIATILPKLSQNNVNTVRLHVEFDSSWDSYPVKSAVFTTSKSVRPYLATMSAGGDCLIPPEVLAEECKLYIVVRGENSTSGATKASTRLTVKVLGGHPAVIISDPSPSVYQQLLARMSAIESAGTADGSEVVGIRTDIYGTEHGNAGDAVRAQVSRLLEKINEQGDRLHNIDGGEGYFRERDFEIGNVSISNSGWDYTKESYSAWRVRSKEGKTFSLEVGDVISLRNYSYVRCYLGWRAEDGTYGYKAWIDKDYTITVKGEYVILLALVNESTAAPKLTEVDELLDYLAIHQLNPEQTILEKLAAVTDTPGAISPRYPSIYKMRDINHRGYNSEAPENTLSAFKLSKLKGFDYVEADVRWTSDNVPVLLHDESINRTARNADGSGVAATVNIANITYLQAREYDFGIWKSSAYAGTKIPKYAEFLELCRNLSLHPYVEIEGNITDEQAAILISEAEKTGMLDHMTFISFYIKSLKKVVALNPRVRVGYIQKTVSGGWADDTQLDNVRSLQTSKNHVFMDLSTTHLDDCIDTFIEAGIPVEVWCPNTEEDVVALPPYVNGVTSDTLLASKVLYDAAIT